MVPSFTRFYWVLFGFYWVLLGFTGLYWVLLGFPGFSWVVARSFPVFSKATAFGGCDRVALKKRNKIKWKEKDDDDDDGDDDDGQSKRPKFPAFRLANDRPLRKPLRPSRHASFCSLIIIIINYYFISFSILCAVLRQWIPLITEFYWVLLGFTGFSWVS